MDIGIFDSQHLRISNDRWVVELNFQREKTAQLALAEQEYNQHIQLSEANDWTATLAIAIAGGSPVEKRCLLTGIDGSDVLLKSDAQDMAQSVKLDHEDLIISLGYTLLSINLTSATENWRISPDVAGIFEFYDLEDDLLLRGEVEIHRIDKRGNLKWSYGGADIWVNVDGQREVQIREGTIHLIDFQSNEYEIDFNGETVSHRPRLG